MMSDHRPFFHDSHVANKITGKHGCIKLNALGFARCAQEQGLDTDLPFVSLRKPVLNLLLNKRFIWQPKFITYALVY